MRRTLVGSAVIAMLLVVLAASSGFRLATDPRPLPSDVGIEAPDDPPFEFGSVNDSQSFR